MVALTRHLLLAATLAIAPVAHAADPKDNANRATALLDALLVAPDEQAAQVIETRLHDVWRHASTPGCTMLLERAVREAQAGSGTEAAADADAVLVLDPEFAEAFAVRAAARLTAGDTGAAVRDAAEALRREPRSIGALQILSRAAELRQDFKTSFEAWQRLLALDPKVQDGDRRLHELRRRAVGEDI